MESLDGFWWDPQNPEVRWPGTLRFDDSTGATLKLLLQPAPPFLHDLREYDVILGLATTGQEVSLLRAFNKSTDEIFSNAAIVGFHAISADPPIKTAVVRFHHLDEWWNRSSLSPDLDAGWPNISIQYRQPPPVVVCDDSQVRVSICSGLTGSIGQMQHLMKEEIHLELAAATSLPLSEFQWRIDACKDLLAVACQSLCDVEYFRLVPFNAEQQEYPDVGQYHAVPVFADRERASSTWPDVLFRAQDVRERLPDIFDSWLTAARSLSVVRSLYLTATYGKSFIELRLLHLAQAIEAFHRRCREGVYMDADEFAARISSPLTQAIPAGIDQSLRDSLKNRVKYGNEFSFVKRLTMLVREFEAGLKAVTPHPMERVSRIATYRNEFTHHPVIGDGSHSIDREDVLRCNYFLRTLLELCFLSSMGLSTTEIAAFATRCHTYNAIRRRFFADH